MKRNALIRHLRAYGYELRREGKKHSMCWNPRNQRTASVPRHVEIGNHLARKIRRDLDIALPWVCMRWTAIIGLRASDT